MKLAVCIAPDLPDARARCERMAAAQCVDPFRVAATCAVPGGAVAVLDSAANPLAPHLFRQSADGSFVAAAGLPLADSPIAELLASCLTVDHDVALRRLAALDGAHASLLYHASSGRLGLVTDILGMQPLYVAGSGAHCLMASELKAFAASGLVPVRPDPAGWGAFLSFGHTIGSRTMLQGVKRAAPATITTLELPTCREERTSYWSWPPAGPRTPLDAVDTSALLDPLRSDVQRYLRYGSEGTILLSGGFDSRLLLALVMEAGGRPAALTLAHANEARGADGRFACALAELAGLECRVVRSPADFYQSAAYLDYLLRSDCSTQSLFLFIAQLAPHVEPSLGAIWEGVFPEPALRPPESFRDDPRVLGSGTNEGIWTGAELVLSRDTVAAMREEFSALLAAERAQYAGPDEAKQFFVRNRTRNRTAPNPLSVYGGKVLPFTPGLNRQLFEANVSIPADSSSKAALSLRLLRQEYPRFMRVPVISGGRLVPRSRGDVAWALEQSAVSSAALVRRLSGSRLGRWLGTPPPAPRWQTSGMIDRVIALAGAGDDRLDGAAVQAIRGAATPSRHLARARRVLFYWTIWHWIMDGTLRPERIAELTAPE